MECRSPLDSSQRVGAHHSRVCSMGAVLARLPGSVQMRQPSCGGSPPVTVLQGPRGHAPPQVSHIGCHLYGVYIDTHSNHLADDLSRNHVLSFLSKVPSADCQPTPTSPELLSLLLNPQADWILQQWRQQFSTIFRKAWPPSAHKTSGAAMKQFFPFCTQFNILSITEYLLCCFAAFLADAPQSVKGYLAAVRNMQVSLGLPDPRDQSSLPMLKRVQAGIQRIRSVAGLPPGPVYLLRPQ